MHWTGTILTILLFLFGAARVPIALQAQELPPTRVAVVNFQEALLATDEMQAKGKELESKFVPRRDELARRAQELQDLQREMQAAEGAAVLSLQSELQRKQRDAQRMQEDFQADAEFERTEILGEGAQMMRSVIAELAAAKGLDIVVDISNTLFVKPVLDLSGEATAAYNRKKQAQ